MTLVFQRGSCLLRWRDVKRVELWIKVNRMTRTEYNRAVDHSDGVYRFILKMCKSKEMAEDVVQDSFMKLWEEG